MTGERHACRVTASYPADTGEVSEAKPHSENGWPSAARKLVPGENRPDRKLQGNLKPII